MPGASFVFSEMERWRTNSALFVQSGMVGVKVGVAEGVFVTLGSGVLEEVGVGVKVREGSGVAEGWAEPTGFKLDPVPPVSISFALAPQALNNILNNSKLAMRLILQCQSM